MNNKWNGVYIPGVDSVKKEQPALCAAYANFVCDARYSRSIGKEVRPWRYTMNTVL